MSVEASRKRLLRFGAFEVDLGAADLRKHGLLVRHLCADGTVVDYDAGLNAAVTRLHQSVSDSAETPRYIGTVERLGDASPAAAPQPSAPPPSAVQPSAPPRFKLMAAAVASSDCSGTRRWIYFLSAQSGADEIWKIPSAGGAPVQVTPSGGYIVMEAPAVNTLYRTKTNKNADLFRSDLDGAMRNWSFAGLRDAGCR